MSLGNKLTQTVLVQVLAEAWRAHTGSQFSKYFDTLETADEADLNNAGTWPVIEDQFIEVVSSTPVGQSLQIKMNITFRDPWLSCVRRKHICLIDIGLKSNKAIISVRSPAGTLATMVKPRYVEVSDGFVEVCDTVIDIVDKMREGYRINFNGKRLNHWYKQSSLIWDACQAQRLPDNKHFIEVSSKRRANPDNAVIKFDNVPLYTLRLLVKRVLDTVLFVQNAHVHERWGDVELIAGIVATLIGKKQMKFGAFVKYMTKDL